MTARQDIAFEHAHLPTSLASRVGAHPGHAPHGDARIRVGILHAVPLIAAGVVHSLVSEAGIAVRPLRQQEDARNAVDVLVADFSRGIEMARAIRADTMRQPALRLLIVASDDRECDARHALECGVLGYVLSDCEPGELVQGIRAVSEGARYISQSVARRVAQSMAHIPLTPREHEVLQLIARGLCNKSIARRLVISVGTVKAHVKAVLAKLGATSRTHAACLALARGLVAPDASG